MPLFEDHPLLLVPIVIVITEIWGLAKRALTSRWDGIRDQWADRTRMSSQRGV